MGMDAYIFRAKSKKIFENPNWYNEAFNKSEDDENSNSLVTEVWYSYKYWDLINQVSFIKNTNEDNGEYIELRKKDIEEMLKIATHTPDYWNGFDSVPSLCKILYNFDEDKENGWHYYFNFDA